MKVIASLFLKRLLLPLAAVCFFQTGSVIASPQTSGELATNFAQPPPSARPWVYWFWCNGNVSKDGITADLEAMKRVGIGGVLIMDSGYTTPPGPVLYNSPLWHELIKFAIQEAARLGLQVNLTNAPGWAGSGGPWNTPEHSEQMLVWTETHVTGPAHLDQVLARRDTGVAHLDQTMASPEAVKNSYRDVALLAYPTPEAEGIRMADFSPKFTASVSDPGADPQTLAAATLASPLRKPVMLPRAEPGEHPYIQVEFAKPFTARMLTAAMVGSPIWARFEAELQSSDDGVNFKPVRPFAGKLSGIDGSFDAVTARYFRLVYTKSDVRMPARFGVLSWTLSPHVRIDDMKHKTLMERAAIDPKAIYPTLPSNLTVDSRRLVDLSAKMAPDGHLVWDVPAGNWTLLRVGHISRGIENHPAPVGGVGLEVDKLSREAVDIHFNALMAKVIAEARPDVGKTLVMTHIDSWESGTQNWTPKFREEFKARRGYDLLPYLPAMTGMVIDSPEVTERFLWDFRQTVAELLAENYAGRMQELAHDHGIQLSIEPYGDGPFDTATYGARADVPMCEFWRVPKELQGSNVGDIEMPSVAHVYGKPIVAAEAFTCTRDERWLGYPGNIKAQGDWAFCMGINRFVFSCYAMQPWPNRVPGMSFGPFGLHYERTQTWWEQSGPWHEYLSRCQYLLQQGRWVADICHLAIERAPNGLDTPHGPGLLGERPGYNYDAASAEAVMTRFSVKDGKLVLPDGMSYRVLTLPDVQTMTPALLRKIKALVSAGATVIGPKPLKSPGLSNYPACDDEIKSLAGELWGDCDGKTIREHACGKGRIIWGKTAEQVLQEMNLPPDFTYDDSRGGPSLLYCHHVLDGTDFYFVANKQNQAVSGTAHFRIGDRQPEFWWPESGRIEPVAAYTQENGVTAIPMRLDSSQSVFVVFRHSGRSVDPVASVALDGAPIIPPAAEPPATPVERVAQLEADGPGKLRLEAWKNGTYAIKTASGKTRAVTVATIPPPTTITGSWQATFPFQKNDIVFDKLASWSDSAQSDVKYFSGTATYHKTFRIPPGMLGTSHRLDLDLGDVEVNAEVTLNGKNLGILWKAPYRVDITDAARVGGNTLEIKVTDLWPNRLIGDAQLPPDPERAADGSMKSWPKWLLDGKPDPSGRQTFSSWNLWKKDDALIPSGLIGPVMLRASTVVAAP